MTSKKGSPERIRTVCWFVKLNNFITSCPTSTVSSFRHTHKRKYTRTHEPLAFNSTTMRPLNTHFHLQIDVCITFLRGERGRECYHKFRTGRYLTGPVAATFRVMLLKSAHSFRQVALFRLSSYRRARIPRAEPFG